MMQNKRTSVCFLVSSWGGIGGAVRVAVQLANRMARDYDVHFLEMHDAGLPCAFPLDPGISQASLLKGDDFRLSELMFKCRRPLRSYLTKQGIDVLFLVGTYPGAVSLTLGPLRKTKVIFCDHGAISNQLDDKQITVVRRFAPRFCSKTISLTKRNEWDYREMFHLPASRVTTIPNWIPSSLWEKEQVYKPESKSALWVARLDPEKGFDHLIEIVSRAQDVLRREGWHVDAYGGSVLSCGIDYEQELSIRGIDDLVFLKGTVDDMYERYSDYAVTLLTSYREGLPLVLLESQACGIPSLSFDVVTGPSEIIVEGENGFLIQPYDCEEYADRFAQIVEDAALRERLAGRTRELVKKFSEDVVYPQWVRLIEELV